MTKRGLIDAVAKRLGLSKTGAAQIVENIFGLEGIIGVELRRGGKVQISGFGSFELRRRAARQTVNPRTGKTMHIKASVVPAFRPGRPLKELVNRRRS
ncbi:MAG TPA: HU family DNA-binding protein [Gemmatimonadales bacterium]|nr:HU family DNA-binding protein [Gemmatimonadales bacterium]